MRLENYELNFRTGPADAGFRLDVVLTRALPDLLAAAEMNDVTVTRSRVAEWIEHGRVFLDGVPVTKGSLKVKSDSSIKLSVPEANPSHLLAESSVEFKIVHEDDDLLVIDKPPGLVVHPGAGQVSGTLVNGLIHYLGDKLEQIGDGLRPGIVHRLDKDTSGLMVVAKSESAYHHLVRQFVPPRTVKRCYTALAMAIPRRMSESVVAADRNSGTITFQLGRNLRDRTKMATVKTGKSAVTHWQILEAFRYATLLHLEIDTGRTHQIRVHLEAVGAPIIGDPVYSKDDGRLPPLYRNAAKRFGRQALHASELSFIHPRTSQTVKFSSELAPDLKELVALFRDGSVP